MTPPERMNKHWRTRHTSLEEEKKYPEVCLLGFSQEREGPGGHPRPLLQDDPQLAHSSCGRHLEVEGLPARRQFTAGGPIWSLEGDPRLLEVRFGVSWKFHLFMHASKRLLHRGRSFSWDLAGTQPPLKKEVGLGTRS